MPENLLCFNLRKDHFFNFVGQIPPRGVCGVFGDSGAGKTSLVRALVGLDNKFIGEVTFKGCVWQDSNHFVKTEKRQIGMVFQEPRLFPHLDTLGNLTLTLNKHSLHSKAYI